MANAQTRVLASHAEIHQSTICMTHAGFAGYLYYIRTAYLRRVGVEWGNDPELYVHTLSALSRTRLHARPQAPAGAEPGALIELANPANAGAGTRGEGGLASERIKG